MSHDTNPCLTCGACCAFARVSFYWGEADDSPGGSVPVDLTEDVTPFYRAMRGTNQKNPRCAALHGVVGQSAHCTIYEKRPSPCRGFGIQFVGGKIVSTPAELAHCNRARTMYGLPPIEADDWLTESA